MKSDYTSSKCVDTENDIVQYAKNITNNYKAIYIILEFYKNMNNKPDFNLIKKG